MTALSHFDTNRTITHQQTGPISRLQIKSNIPLSLHGMWAADAQFEGEDVLRKFKVYTGLSKFKEIDSAMQSIF